MMKLKLSLLCTATGLALMHGAIAASLSEDDQRFLRKAGESGMLEIQASQLAAQKAQHTEMKRFAEKMIQDHTADDNELKILAEKKSSQMPVELDGKQRNLKEELGPLDGPSF